MVLYNGPTYTWDTKTHIGVGDTLVMQHDGNLVIYNANKTALWNSGTAGNPSAYLELTDFGHLAIKNSDGNVISNMKDRVREYIHGDFYNNSPNIVFSDKKGRFFPFTWGNNDNETKDGILHEDKLPNDDCTGADDFRGWCLSENDDGWNKHELDLKSIYSYSEKPTGEDNKPNKADHEGILSDNYNRGYDRTYFFSDGGTHRDRTGVIRRKPVQIRDGVSKSNYLPGYTRVSYVDGTEDKNMNWSYRFLIMQRGSLYNNQAFVLYAKHRDRNAFADDIINNHPEIVEGLRNHFKN